MKCLYEILKVDRHSSSDVIKKAYYRLALVYHPDRIGRNDTPEATKESKERFQEVALAYEVLMDQERRALYDRTGSFEGTPSQMEPSITMSDIDKFKEYYIGSIEEYEDILSFYLKFDGDIALVGESIFFGCPDEEQRYKEIVERAIRRGILPVKDEFKKIVDDESVWRAQQRKRQKAGQKEAREAKKMTKELGLRTGGGKGGDNLYELIQSKQKNRFDSMIGSLEEKYGSKKH